MSPSTNRIGEASPTQEAKSPPTSVFPTSSAAPKAIHGDQLASKPVTPSIAKPASTSGLPSSPVLIDDSSEIPAVQIIPDTPSRLVPETITSQPPHNSVQSTLPTTQQKRKAAEDSAAPSNKKQATGYDASAKLKLVQAELEELRKANRLEKARQEQPPKPKQPAASNERATMGTNSKAQVSMPNSGHPDPPAMANETSTTRARETAQIVSPNNDHLRTAATLLPPPPIHPEISIQPALPRFAEFSSVQTTTSAPDQTTSNTTTTQYPTVSHYHYAYHINNCSNFGLPDSHRSQEGRTVAVPSVGPGAYAGQPRHQVDHQRRPHRSSDPLPIQPSIEHLPAPIRHPEHRQISTQDALASTQASGHQQTLPHNAPALGHLPRIQQAQPSSEGASTAPMPGNAAPPRGLHYLPLPPFRGPPSQKAPAPTLPSIRQQGLLQDAPAPTKEAGTEQARSASGGGRTGVDDGKGARWEGFHYPKHWLP